MLRAVWITASLALAAALVLADLSGPFPAPFEHPAIAYWTTPATGAIADLNREIRNGEVHLKFDGPSGYLRSVLDALHIPVESQMLVFSKTSFQNERIDPSNPRSLFFNDTVAIGWVRGGDILEAASEDPRQGAVFYTLDNEPTAKPQFQRQDKSHTADITATECLRCHESYDTLDVPGMLLRSVYPDAAGTPMYAAGTYVADDSSPMNQRWGGWYVTGDLGSTKHLGNLRYADPQNPHPLSAVPARNPHSMQGRFDLTGYLTPYSDIVALLVFEHQMHMTNLLTRGGWEIRLAEYQEQHGAVNREFVLRRLRQTTDTIVDYMLFINEAPLGGKVQGSSGFAAKFAAEGPFDRRGRSLRQFDLDQRLMRYPCSYMIYSPAFDALPLELKASIGERMWQILSGADHSPKYARLSQSDRQALIEILRDTKKDLFRSLPQ